MSTEINSLEYLQQCRAALSSEQAYSLSQTNNWAHVNKDEVHRDWDVLYRKLAPLIDQSPPTSPEVQALIARHYEIVSRFYAPSKMAYIGISLFYAENPDMKSFHNGYHPNLVEFLAKAIPLYAHSNL